jgi:hypothetical protein
LKPRLIVSPIFTNGLWKFSLNPHSYWIILFVEVSNEKKVTRRWVCERYLGGKRARKTAKIA